MKYFRWTIGLILALSLVLAGCSPQTEEPAPSNNEPAEMSEVSEAPADTQESTSTEPENATVEESATAESATESDTETMLPEMTLEELSKYNGQDDQPIYVAVDGVVYDVSSLAKWAGGKHMGHEAGQDLSEAILNSPHGKAILERATPVATLVE